MSKKSRTKPIMLKGSDVANMVDAVFIGAQDDPGWVEMYADAKGRECVNALFPKAHIAWADDCGEMLPREWRAFTINLPDVVAATETLLPLEITRGANLDEATPDALAFLLAMGVHRQGARCAVWHGGRLDIYVPSGRRQQLAAVLKLSAADRDTAACRPPSLVHPAGAGRRA